MSPTIDEPICELAGYLHVREGDFAFDADNPPLWKLWAMIPNLGRTLLPENAPPGAGGSGGAGFITATRRLFQTPGNDGDSFVNRSRAMMTLLGMALVAATARWGWQLGGASTAIVASALVAFDPNFLAHASLMKADVAVVLITFCTAWATWRIGRHATVANISALCVLCGAAATAKYNATAAGMIAFGLLTCRALSHAPWPALGGSLSSRASRMLAVATIGVLMLAATVAIVWACYAFRFEPSRVAGARLDLDEQVRLMGLPEGAPPPPSIARVTLFLDRHRLMPQAWLHGLLSIYRSSATVSRQSYLMDEVSESGWWYYFPLAMLFKAPLATIAAVIGALIVSATSRRKDDEQPDDVARRWTMLCIGVPTTAYLLAAMTGHVNVGVRHVLPVYPPIYLAIGLAAKKLRYARPRAFRIVVPLLGAALVIETLIAFPNDLSFFNAVARPHRMYLLSDSNFDWGQGLKSVAAWQREHPDVPLYFGYWGTVDPAFYGIRYTAVPGGFPTPGAQPHVLSPSDPPGVLMIGATLLQGVNYPPPVREYYRRLRELSPDQVIGDCIYVYRWPRSAIE